jgi:hypothetical protein
MLRVKATASSVLLLGEVLFVTFTTAIVTISENVTSSQAVRSGTLAHSP